MNRTTSRAGATALALACLTPVALAATPAVADTVETGTLTLTIFEDHYADARFDPSLENIAGESDVLRKNANVYLQDSAGDWFRTTSESTGEYIFDGIAPGEATVYVGDPNPYGSVAFFFAEGDEATLMPHGEVSFDDGTYLYANSDERLTPHDGREMLAGGGTVTVGTNTEALIGMTGVDASVHVLTPEGEPVHGAAEVTFLAAGEQIESMPIEWNTSYYPVNAALVPDDLGIVVEPIVGYAVGQVTAQSSISGQPLTVTERDGAYFVDTTQLPRYFDRAEYTVQLVDAPSSKEECKDGGWEVAYKNQGECVSFFATGGKR